MSELSQLAKKPYRLLKKTYRIFQQGYFRIAGSKIECNVCGYKANHFVSDKWHKFSICPNCFSSFRQRLLVASLTYLDDFAIDKIISTKRVLHFAPEKSIGNILTQTAGVYKTADLLTEGYLYGKLDYNSDISKMPEIKDASYDCIIACDVLEHVPDHMGAMREVYRALSRGGYCIFTVPQKDNLEITLEDLTLTDKKERELKFGQFDHLRIYGADFPSMMQSTGFEVTSVDVNYFKKEIVEKHVLFPPILSSHPLATNYRKIFFGKKI